MIAIVFVRSINYFWERKISQKLGIDEERISELRSEDLRDRTIGNGGFWESDPAETFDEVALEAETDEEKGTLRKILEAGKEVLGESDFNYVILK